jgi:hypothetical protein
MIGQGDRYLYPQGLDCLEWQAKHPETMADRPDPLPPEEWR